MYSSKATWGTTKKSYDEVIGNLKIEDFKSSLHNKLPTQEEVDIFKKDNSHKTGKDLTIEYLQNDVEILDYCMKEYVKLSMKEFKLNPLHYVSLPGYSFDCWLMSSGVTLDTLQDKQMLDDFVGAKRGGICGIMGDRYIDNSDKNCYQFRKVKSFEYKITAECDYKKRTKEEVKTTKIFFNTDYINNNAIYEYGDFNRWLDFAKEIYEGYGYNFEFLGIRSIQLNIEPTKASIGSYIDLPPDLKNSKSILNIRSYKYNCLQLTITAWLHPAPHHGTRESKFVDKLIEPRQQHEDDFAYIIRIQKLYNIKIWVYTPCGGGKIESFKQVDDFEKDRKDVRILVWSNGQI